MTESQVIDKIEKLARESRLNFPELSSALFCLEGVSHSNGEELNRILYDYSEKCMKEMGNNEDNRKRDLILWYIQKIESIQNDISKQIINDETTNSKICLIGSSLCYIQAIMVMGYGFVQQLHEICYNFSQRKSGKLNPLFYNPN